MKRCAIAVLLTLFAGVACNEIERPEEKMVPISFSAAVLDGIATRATGMIGDDASLQFGVLIESPNFWKNYTGFEVLKTLAAIKKVISDDEIKNAMKRVLLDPEDKRTISKYSLGMKQKLGIAQAIMEHPDIILLDEPTNALDKKSVTQVRQILLEEKKRGAIVIIASHNSQDIDLCDQMIEVTEGMIENA